MYVDKRNLFGENLYKPLFLIKYNCIRKLVCGPMNIAVCSYSTIEEQKIMNIIVINTT